MGRINKPNKTTPVSADEFIIYDSEDTSDDKNVTLGQIASFTESQDSTVTGTKIFTDGVELQKGSIAFGQYSPLPTSLGTYVAQYTHPTYGARLLGYNGSAYQDLSIGSMPTAGTVSMKSLANGNCNFGYNVNIAEDLVVTGDVTANKFIGDGSELTGIVSGVSEFDNKGTVTTNITLAENKITTGYWSGTNTITLPTVTDTTKQIVCILDFTTATSGQPTITNTNLRWSDKNGGKPPTSYSIISGVQNILVFKSIWISSVLYWEAEYTTYGGVETTFIQPTLSADGTMGTDNFAVSSSGTTAGHPAWHAADNNTGTWFEPTGANVPYHYYWFIKSQLKASSITIVEYSINPNRMPTNYTIYGSQDNINKTVLATGTITYSPTQIISIPEVNRGFYRYYEMYSTTSSSGNIAISQQYLSGIYIAT